MKMTKKKQLEIAFKKLLVEMLEYGGITDFAPIIIDKYTQKLLYEVSIRTSIE